MKQTAKQLGRSKLPVHEEPLLGNFWMRLMGIIVSVWVSSTCLLEAAQATANEPKAPLIPNRVFKITNYGAIGDGVRMNTEAFRKAIQDCQRAGGGRVVVPTGKYLTGPIELISHMALIVEPGATVQASGKFADFGIPEPFPQTQEEMNRSRSQMKPLISGADLTDVAILGGGVIDGQGAGWWALSDHTLRGTGQVYVLRPNMICFNRCRNLQIQGVTLSNSPQFHLVPIQCEDVLIEAVHIFSPQNSPNTDGIDPSNSKNVLIRRCVIDCGDDNIAVKSGNKTPCEGITVANCTLKHGHGISIGSQTSGGVRNMLVRDCSFENTGTALRIKSARDRGGVVEEILYRDITMKNVDAAITVNLYYDDKSEAKKPEHRPVTAKTPSIRNVKFLNIKCEDAKSAGEIVALPEMPAMNLALENVHISARTGFRIQDARGLQFKEVEVVTSAKPPEPAKASGPEREEQPDAPQGGSHPGLSNKVPVAGADPVVDGEGDGDGHRTPLQSGVDFVVDGEGRGSYRTVQEAVNAAVADKGKRHLILIKAGHYKEKIHVPKTAVPICFRGEDPLRTVLTFDDSADTIGSDGNKIGTFRSASFTIDADEFAAENLTFENAHGKGSQAVAIKASCKRGQFWKCRFLGWQDTMLLTAGRDYFEGCYIAGSVDFIMGDATAWFEQCELHCVDSGAVTAASTPQEREFGFVFSGCKITSEPNMRATVLGRPWRPYANVVFLNTEMSAAIAPKGWDNWKDPEKEKTARYGEYHSTGPGANSEGRVSWAKALNDQEASGITRNRVLGWAPK